MKSGINDGECARRNLTALTAATLVSHLALAAQWPRGRPAFGRCGRLRCIQIDPLDVIGTNADLVWMARVNDARRGDVWKHLFRSTPSAFAKERSILPRMHSLVSPARAREQTPWWRHNEREQRCRKAGQRRAR